MKVVAGDDKVEANNFGMYRVLEKALRVVLLLCRPIPQPKRGNQLHSRLEAILTIRIARLKHARTVISSRIVPLGLVRA